MAYYDNTNVQYGATSFRGHRDAAKTEGRNEAMTNFPFAGMVFFMFLGLLVACEAPFWFIAIPALVVFVLTFFVPGWLQWITIVAVGATLLFWDGGWPMVDTIMAWLPQSIDYLYFSAHSVLT